MIEKGKGRNSQSHDQEGKKKVPPPYKKALNESQIKCSKPKATQAPEKGPDSLLGNNIPERKRPKKLTKSKGPTNTINETDM